VASSREEVRKGENEVALQVHALYYNILITRLHKKAAEEDNVSASTRLRESEGDVRNGSALRATVMEARAGLLESEQTVLTATLRLSDLTTELNDLLGLPLDTALELDGVESASFQPSTREEYLRDAWAGNPQIHAAEESVRQATAGVTAAKTAYTATGTQAYQIALLNTQQGRCYSCHSPGGAGGQWLGIANNATAQNLMYGKWQQEVFFTGVFQAQIQGDNTYKIGAADSKICNKGKEKANSLGTHPTFDCTQNNSTGLNNLKAFVTLVQGLVDNKDPSCGPAQFAPPTP